MIIDLLINSFGKPKHNEANKVHFAFNCPNCAELYNNDIPDGKFNMEVNLAKKINNKNIKVFRCWKCEESGTVKNLLYKWGNRRDYETYKEFELDDIYYEDTKKKQVYQIQLPKEFISLSTYKKQEYLEYINKRGFNDGIIKFLNIGYCNEGHYINRIVIPSYDKYGELNYFVTRSIDDKCTEKHLNPYVDKTSIIANEININWNHPVNLVEGYFDLGSYPPNTIPLLGKVIFNNLLEKLKKNKTPIIIILDPDAYNKSLDIVDILEINNIKVIKNIYLKNNGKDLNEILVDSGKSGIFDQILKQ